MSAPKTCERCGQSFACGANDSADCACGAVRLTADQQAQIRERYTDCLCIECLRALATELQG